MTRARFELALERIASHQWSLFEALASQFLTSEFSSLRTLATPSGDEGRDAVLFSPNEDPSIVLQYSVTPDWKEKIKKTLKRVTTTHPETRLLIYVSNQQIGALADPLRKDLKTTYKNIYIDIRDRNWFLDRMNTDAAREAAAHALVEQVADPYLVSKGFFADKAQALTSIEAQAAFVYLGLQWQDDTQQKGLTRLCFEALVKSVLRSTTSATPMPRVEIYKQVRQILPTHPEDMVDRFTEAALTRLSRQQIRHNKELDQFHLSHQESVRIKDALAIREKSRLELSNEIDGLVKMAFPKGSPEIIQDVTNRSMRVMENFLLSRGEMFASSVKTGSYKDLGLDDIKDFVIRDRINHRPPGNSSITEETIATVSQILFNPSQVVHEYVRSLKDSYTLLAFLRETPDVQSAVVKMFAEGEIWLDTTAVLPLFAEVLIESGQKPFTTMIEAAVSAGLTLRITKGVLEEVERHMNKCIICSRAVMPWTGRTPFLYMLYILSGRSAASFSSWIERFRGNERPEEDIAEYIKSEFNIQVGSLETEANRAPVQLRGAVEEIWHEAHERRRSQSGLSMDAATTHRLVMHDTENFLGVIFKRSEDVASALGYKIWWLTLDGTAYDVINKLKERITDNLPASPVMSPDFLGNYLAFGPIRSKISRDQELQFPILTAYEMADVLPKEIFDIAEKARDEAKDLPEYLIRRRVRDSLDAARKRLGPVAGGGLPYIEQTLKTSVVEKK